MLVSLLSRVKSNRIIMIPSFDFYVCPRTVVIWTIKCIILLVRLRFLERFICWFILLVLVKVGFFLESPIILVSKGVCTTISNVRGVMMSDIFFLPARLRAFSTHSPSYKYAT